MNHTHKFYPKCLGLRVIGAGFNLSSEGIESSFDDRGCDFSTIILTLARPDDRSWGVSTT